MFTYNWYNVKLYNCLILDSTAEYINGTKDKDCQDCQDDSQTFSTGGLKCVTVLIGVYDLETGGAIMGIVNQPFSSYQDGRYLKNFAGF